MTPLRPRMIDALQLRGLAERTQEMSVRAVRQLADHAHQSPEQITEEERRDYCLYRKNVQHSSRAASPIALGGIPFFSEQTLKRAWTTLTCVSAPRAQKRPVGLSLEEVRTMLGHLPLCRSRACLTTIDACGLRLQAGPHRQVPAIDRAPMLVHVRCGKGAKDRYGPLPPHTLVLLRPYWRPHRHPLWRFPAPGRRGLGMATASPPMPRHRVPEALRAALNARGSSKRASVPTRRHRSATPLLEAGVPLRLRQDS
jgi:integrase/recombinase XerD